MCLEQLVGTVVHLGCCKKQVHIQCYLPKCPMCRAELPSPPLISREVIVPVPVYIEQRRQQTRAQKVLGASVFITSFAVTLLFVFTPR